MRKYYNYANAEKRAPWTKLEKSICPWEVFSFFLKENGELLPSTYAPRFWGAVHKQSVAMYLSIVGDLEMYLQNLDTAIDPAIYFACRQACTLLKKYPFASSDLPTDPRTVAIQKWTAAEDSCRATNVRISGLSIEDIPQWVYIARELILSVLQPLTPSRVMRIITRGVHGPGSTLTSRGNRVTSYYKYLDLPYSCTKSALPYAFAAMSSDPQWVEYLESTGRRKEIPPFDAPLFQKELMLFQECVVEMSSDRVTFVPKDCRTDRPIAVGASLNMFLQLGVKSYMEKRLKLVGVDLTDQSRNQKLSKLGSRFPYTHGRPNPDQFSTIDLASASDTISLELVRLLLPSDWFAFLSDLRHESGDFLGEVITYQKFSAMGNGFTFPLESLLFWAICMASMKAEGYSPSKNDIAVYGDDIITRLKYTPPVLRALSWAGFQINQEKSFLSGWFKESCGTDYYRGYNVRPFYLKRELRTYEDCYYLLNWIDQKNITSDFPIKYAGLYRCIIDRIPFRHRAFGPMSGSDTYLNVPLSVLSTKGLRPWLSPGEFRSIVKKKSRCSRFIYQNDPIFFDYRYAAVPYKANQQITYLLSLSGDTPIHQFGAKWMFSLPSENDGRFAYRRNSIRKVIRVSSSSSWNGDYSSRLLRKSYSFSVENCMIT